MYEIRPVLYVVVPHGWEAIPEAYSDLCRCLAEEYGGSLMLRAGHPELTSPIIHFAGYWEPGVLPHAKRDLRPRVEATFFTLAWMGLDEVI